MKKLLLLSALSVFAQVRTEEVKLSELRFNNRGFGVSFKEFKHLLQNTTYPSIQCEIEHRIDPATGQFNTQGDESLTLKTTFLAHGCQQIINILDLHDGNYVNLNTGDKQELQQLLPLCSDFYSNIKEAITDSSLIAGERDIVIKRLTILQNKAIERMRSGFSTRYPY